MALLHVNQRETIMLATGRKIIKTRHTKHGDISCHSPQVFKATNMLTLAFRSSVILLAVISCSLQASSANVFFSPEQLKSAVPVKFAANGKALLTIVIPKHAQSIEKDAADELAKYLGEMTGAKFDIAVGDVPPAKPVISLGHTEAAKRAGFTEVQMRCPDQGYKIFVKDGSIYLFGGMRMGIGMGMNGTRMGLFYAVSALLEEDLGVRLYTDKWSLIPHDENLTAKIVQRSDKPDFGKRLLLTYKGICNNIPWSRFNRVFYNNGFDHVPFWFAGTYSNILPRSEFSKHPELFAKDAEGNPSPLQLDPSNPEIEKIAVKKMLAALKDYHEPGTIIDLSHNDKEFYCKCPECRKLNRKYGAEIGAQLELVNKVADAIGKVYPDVTVDFLIYREFYSDPPNDKIKMAKNTSGWYTVLPPSEAYFRKNKLWVQRLEGWQKVVPKVYMWDNSIDFGFYCRALPVIAAKADNLRFWKKHNIPGVLILDSFTGEIPWGPLHALRSWVLNKLLWNCSLDYNELAKDFCYGVFGKCGPEAYEYYQLVSKPGIFGKTIEEYYGLQTYFDRANEIIKCAYAKAAGDEELTKRLNLYFFGVLFAQLENIYDAYPGNKDNFPTKQYKELYTKVTEIVKQWNIQAYNECMRMEGKLYDMGILLDPAWDGSLKSYARCGIIYYGMLRCDPLVNNQLVGKLPPDGDWAVQWHYPGRLLIPGKKYQLRVELRLEEEPKEELIGNFKVGISSVMEEEIKLSTISPKSYRYFNIGKPVVPDPKGYVWFALSNGSNLSGVYVNRVELIPVK